MATAHTGMPDTETRRSSLLRLLASVGIIVVLGVIAFVVWAYIRNSHMTSQAENVARTFIQSSPKLAQTLGPIVSVKEKDEARVNGPMSGWKVDMDVTGKKASGMVEMVLQNVNGEWNVPYAKLDQGNGKITNLM